MSTQVVARSGGYDVVVRAQTLVRELCLLADRVAPDAEVDEQLVTLLPGETAVLRVDLPHLDRGADGPDRLALVSRPVLRAVNDAQIHRARASSDLSRRLVGADRKGTLA
jgi:beta-mannosidase